MIKAKNIMIREVITVSQTLGILEAAKLGVSKSVSLLVVLEKNKPVAILSESDIIKAVISKKRQVKDAMNGNFLNVTPETAFNEISKSLREHNIKRFLVVENNRLVGLITETDILEATRDFTRMHQAIQDIILAIFGIATTFFLFYFSPLREAVFG